MANIGSSTSFKRFNQFILMTEDTDKIESLIKKNKKKKKQTKKKKHVSQLKYKPCTQSFTVQKEIRRGIGYS